MQNVWTKRSVGVGLDFVFIVISVTDVSGCISVPEEEECCRGEQGPTLGKEPVGVLDDGLYDGHHVHGGSCSHLSQTPVWTHVDEQKLDGILKEAQITV